MDKDYIGMLVFGFFRLKLNIVEEYEWGVGHDNDFGGSLDEWLRGLGYHEAFLVGLVVEEAVSDSRIVIMRFLKMNVVSLNIIKTTNGTGFREDSLSFWVSPTHHGVNRCCFDSNTVWLDARVFPDVVWKDLASPNLRLLALSLVLFPVSFLASNGAVSCILAKGANLLTLLTTHLTIETCLLVVNLLFLEFDSLLGDQMLLSR